MTDWEARKRECWPNGPPPYPPEGTYEMDIDVHIRCVETGEVRVFHTKGLCNKGDDSFWDFIWEEGNFSCDCNRGIFFAEAGGTTEESDERECGQGAYLVEKIVRLDTGMVVYADDQ